MRSNSNGETSETDHHWPHKLHVIHRHYDKDFYIWNQDKLVLQNTHYLIHTHVYNRSMGFQWKWIHKNKWHVQSLLDISYLVHKDFHLDHDTIHLK